MFKQAILCSCVLAGLTVNLEARAARVDGALLEIGDDNDRDGGHRNVGLINLLDDRDPNRRQNRPDGLGALVEVGPDNNNEDGTLLDLLDNPSLVKGGLIEGIPLLGGLVESLLGGGLTGGLTGGVLGGNNSPTAGLTGGLGGLGGLTGGLLGQ